MFGGGASVPERHGAPPTSSKEEPPGGWRSVGLSAGGAAQRLVAAAAAALLLLLRPQQWRLGVSLPRGGGATAEEAGPAVHQTVEEALRGRGEGLGGGADKREGSVGGGSVAFKSMLGSRGRSQLMKPHPPKNFSS